MTSLLFARCAVFFHFILEGTFNSLWSAVLPATQTSLRLSDSTLGYACLFNYLGTVVATPLAGFLLRRLGSKYATFIGAFFFCTSLALIPMSRDAVELSLTFSYFGITEGVMDVSMNSCAVLTETVRGLPLMGSYHGSYSLASAIGGLLGNLAVQKYREQALFAVVSAVTIVMSCVAAYVMYNKRDEEMVMNNNSSSSNGNTGGDQHPTRSFASGGDKMERKLTMEREDYGSRNDEQLPQIKAFVVVADDEGDDDNDRDNAPFFECPRGPAVYLALVGFLASFGEGSIVTWSNVYFAREIENAPAGLDSIGFASFMTCMAVGRFSCDFLRRIYGRRRIVQIGGILASMGLVILVMAPTLQFSVAFACAGLGITGLGLSTLIPTMFSSAGHLPNTHAGTSIAAVAWPTYAGSIVASPFVGNLSEAFGLRYALLAVALMLLLIFPLGFGMLPEDPNLLQGGGSIAPSRNHTFDSKGSKRSLSSDASLDNSLLRNPLL